MSVFGSGIRPWKRQTETKRAADSSVPGKGELVVSDAGKVYAGDGATQAKNLSPMLRKTDADTTYAPRSSAVGEYDYDSNGNVIATPDGTTYTWETDGAGGFRVKTETVAGVTRNFTYNPNGTLGSVA